MPPAPSPRRPKPSPRVPGEFIGTPPAPSWTDVPDAEPQLPAAGPARVGAESIRVPGMLAALRRSPIDARRACVGAIGVGAALFVVASITTPLAGADLASGRSATKPAASSDLDAILPLLPVESAAPAELRAPERQPVKSVKKAPADPGAISALAANGIPKVALNAYRVAAARLANVEPGCGIHWSLLAGIGREESDHGRFAGAVLHADGTSTPRVVGPALDGVTSDLIPAPGNGLKLAGDAKYAHALGPMQFIPSTWAGYGADATGDGKADIFNINDAALGSARYLCAAGGDLRTKAGRIRAVLAYNHNDEYLAQVLALADAYRLGVPITGIPVGNTTGKLPKVADTGYIPPANPGAPTAAEKQKAAQAKAKARASSSARARASASAASPAPGRTTTAGRSPSPTPTKASATSPKPASSTTTATPSPTKSCNALEKLADNLLPPAQRTCA